MSNRINYGITCFLSFVISGFIGFTFSNLVFYLFEKRFVWEFFVKKFVETGESNIFVYLLIMIIFPGLTSLVSLAVTIRFLDKKNKKTLPVQNKEMK